MGRRFTTVPTGRMIRSMQARLISRLTIAPLLVALLCAVFIASCCAAPVSPPPPGPTQALLPSPEATSPEVPGPLDVIAPVGDVPPGGACGPGVGDCDATGFCSFPSDAPCGAPGVAGVCTARPTGCHRDCPGVCGCNGHRFCNTCVAEARGFSVRQTGNCEEPTDAP